MTSGSGAVPSLMLLLEAEGRDQVLYRAPCTNLDPEALSVDVAGDRFRLVQCDGDGPVVGHDDVKR